MSRPVRDFILRPIPPPAYTYAYGLDEEINAGWMHAVFDLQESRTGRWVEFLFSDPRDLPSIPACYVVLIGGGVAYVGQTENLRARFVSHGFRVIYNPQADELVQVTPWGKFAFGKVVFRRRVLGSQWDRFSVEAKLIHRLDPTYNGGRP